MPDLWFYRILNFLKKGRGSSNVRKIRAIVLKLHTNILHPPRNFGIEFGKNRLKRSNFFRFWIFWEFSQNCLTQANFDLSSWNFLDECTNTEWCLILNFVKISQDLQTLDEFKFFFFIVTSNFLKFDIFTKLPLWESQNRRTSFYTNLNFFFFFGINHLRNGWFFLHIFIPLRNIWNTIWISLLARNVMIHPR